MVRDFGRDTSNARYPSSKETRAPHRSELGSGLQAHVVLVYEDLSEAPGQALLLVGIERLVAEEDDAVLEQRLPDAGDGGVVGVPRQVDAVDLGAERAGDRMDL